MKRLHIFLTLFLFAGILIGFNSCQKDNIVETPTTELAELSNEPTEGLTNTDEPTEELTTRSSYSEDDGAVFVMNNASDDNKILAYKRSENGSLTAAGSFSTGGKGTGGGLGSQNALLRYNNYLYACNAGSNDFTVFKIKGAHLTKWEKIASTGTRPLSITANGELVYVLNGGGDGNIAGFRWGRNGHIVAIQGSIRPLSTSTMGAAQIQFNPWGKVLVVTEKPTNIIDTYEVGSNGVAAAGVAHPSVGMTPFGFAFTRGGRLIVSNAAGGAANLSTLSSYNLSNWGGLNVISAKVADKQSAACWVVVSNDNRYCYTTNTGSNNISGYRIDARGGLSLLNADGITATTGAGPIDFILSENGRYLYTLNGAGRSISIHRVDNNGGLSSVGTVTGLPMGAVGIAAR